MRVLLLAATGAAMIGWFHPAVFAQDDLVPRLFAAPSPLRTVSRTVAAPAAGTPYDPYAFPKPLSHVGDPWEGYCQERAKRDAKDAQHEPWLSSWWPQLVPYGSQPTPTCRHCEGPSAPGDYGYSAHGTGTLGLNLFGWLRPAASCDCGCQSCAGPAGDTTIDLDPLDTSTPAPPEPEFIQPAIPRNVLPDIDH